MNDIDNCSVTTNTLLVFQNFNAIRKGISQSNFTLFLFDSDIQELLLLLSEENSVSYEFELLQFFNSLQVREQHIFYLNMAPRNALLCLCKVLFD